MTSVWDRGRSVWDGSASTWDRGLVARPVISFIGFAPAPIEASGDFEVSVYSTEPLPHPTLRFIPFAQISERTGAAQGRVYARPMLRFNNFGQRLEAVGELAARVNAGLGSIILLPAAQALSASAALAVTIYARPVIEPPRPIGDTWIWPPVDLQEIDLAIHLAPLVRHPDPAIRMVIANLQPPTVWDNPQSPTVWDNGRTIWDYYEPPNA